jgi:hypothetical protein
VDKNMALQQKNQPWFVAMQHSPHFELAAKQQGIDPFNP